MARMMETLNGPAHPAPPPALPARAPAAPPKAPEPPAEVEEPMSFIEVGPRRSVIEASADVLAAPARRPAPEPAAAVPITVRVAPRPAPAEAAEAPPVAPPASVLFRRAAERPLRCKPTFAPDLIAYHAAGQPASAPYRDLLAQLLGSHHGGKPDQVLFFTAGRSEAGTTTVVLNLAITAALQGRSVLVIDANLRRPGVAARMKLGDVPGLREVLAGHFAAEDVVRPTGLPELKALTSGPLTGPARLTVAHDKVRDVLAECRQHHELIFVDGSRWDGRADVTAFGAAADAVYLVVATTEIDTPAIEGLTQLIPEQGGALAGSILVGR